MQHLSLVEFKYRLSSIFDSSNKIFAHSADITAAGAFLCCLSQAVSFSLGFFLRKNFSQRHQLCPLKELNLGPGCSELSNVVLRHLKNMRNVSISDMGEAECSRPMVACLEAGTLILTTSRSIELPFYCDLMDRCPRLSSAAANTAVQIVCNSKCGSLHRPQH